MIVSSVFSSMISLFLLMMCGYVLSKRGIIDERVTKGLSSILLNLCIPAMALFTLQQDFSVWRLQALGLTTLGMIVMVVAGLLPCLLIGRTRKISRSDLGVWLSCAGFSNAVFMVRPLAVTLYGSDADFPISAVLFAFNLMIFSLGTWLMNLGKPRHGSLLRQIGSSMINPTIVALAVGFGLFLFSVPLPGPVTTTLEMLTNLTSPMGMMIIGSLLAGANLRDLVGDWHVYLLAGLRLVVGPLLFYFIARTFLHDPILFNVLLLSASMPTATSVAVFAEKYDNNAVFASKVIFVSTLLSMITVPIFALLLRS